MFNVRIVGTANAIAGGWGNMGGGVTEILMPALTAGIAANGVTDFGAWRWAFFIPGGIFILMGILILLFGVVGDSS
jgi:NNP family nitrate/nitrite transporter-like MFS transporter